MGTLGYSAAALKTGQELTIGAILRTLVSAVNEEQVLGFETRAFTP